MISLTGDAVQGYLAKKGVKIAVDEIAHNQNI